MFILLCGLRKAMVIRAKACLLRRSGAGIHGVGCGHGRSISTTKPRKVCYSIARTPVLVRHVRPHAPTIVDGMLERSSLTDHEAGTAIQPVLVEGPKDRRALNPVKHGVFATPALPGEEEAWKRHRTRIVSALLQPTAGYTERAMAHRIALTLWRLDRIIAWEAQEIEASANGIPDERTLAKIQRYESHLSRQLTQALNILHKREALSLVRAAQVAGLYQAYPGNPQET